MIALFERASLRVELLKKTPIEMMTIKRMNCARLMAVGVFFSLAAHVLAAYQDSRIANFSCLATVNSSDPSPLTLGFVSVTTDVPPLGEPLLIRAVGPTLADFGLSPVVANPVMNFWKAGDNFYSVQDYDAAAAGTAPTVGAFPLIPGSSDAGLLFSFAPGSYTVVIGGATSTTESVLGEIYDVADTGASNYLANVSALSFVHPASQSTLGFILGGSVARSLLIRAIGPSLNHLNVAHALPDPVIALFGPVGNALDANGGWADNIQIANAAMSVGAFPLSQGSADAALFVTLQPGAYTFTVSSESGVAGTVLAEIYLLPQ